MFGANQNGQVGSERTNIIGTDKYDRNGQVRSERTSMNSNLPAFGTDKYDRNGQV